MKQTLLLSTGTAIQKRKANKMASQENLVNGMIAETFPEGIYISGNTYWNKDYLKSLGAVWKPDVKKWRLPPGTDLQPLRPIPVIKPFRRCKSGRCCSKATVEFDKENPQGPLWYICKVHGNYKSNYTGD